MREKAVSIDKLNPTQRQLVSILKEEYSFYQSLYILLDKQRDMIKYDKDDKLLQHLSSLGWEHINLTGDYAWR